METSSMANRESHPISEGIREAIRTSGRSPYKLAAEVRCSPQQLYNFLNGKRKLSQETLDTLGVVLGLEIRVQAIMPIVVTPTVPDANIGSTLTPPQTFGLPLVHHADYKPDIIGQTNISDDDEMNVNFVESRSADGVVPRRVSSERENYVALQTPNIGGEPATFNQPVTSGENPAPEVPRVTPGSEEDDDDDIMKPPTVRPRRPRPGDLRNNNFEESPTSSQRLRPPGEPVPSDNPNGTQPEGLKSKVRRPGQVPRSLVAAPGTVPMGKYDPLAAATRVEKPHFNKAQKDIGNTLDFWGPQVKEFYKSLGRDSEAKSNTYGFLAAARVKNTAELDYMKTFPMPKVLNWVQAFDAEQQVQIAVKLPYLDDGLNEEDPNVTKSFWERVDKDSFYRAVGRLGFEPDLQLKLKYVDRPLRKSKPSKEPTGTEQPNVTAEDET